MGGKAGGRTESHPSSAAGSTFALERFAWLAPDVLEVAGRFSNVPESALTEPVLVVRGGGDTYRLAVTPKFGSRSRVGLRPFGAGRWRAMFTWPGEPKPFDSAALELGDDLIVELPPPGAPTTDRRVLDVGRQSADTLPPTEQLRLQAETAAAREEAEDARGRLQEAEEAVRRLQQDLAAQRTRRKAEAARFHETIETMQSTAEEAVTAERKSTEALRAELQVTHELAEQRQRDLDTMRDEVAAAAEASRAQERLQAEVEEHRRRVSAAREELQRVTDDRDAAVGQLAAVRTALDRLAKSGGHLTGQIDRLRARLTDGPQPDQGEEGSSPGHASSEP
jgi:hypothetical protein